ncbi:MAG TPA: ABC transporter permease subunit [Candidatus Bipolaricaulis sp.]|nr:ABC transporter permease subunit [Candidatus Bipolaricaulis sp.]HRS13451.1 ABC transporter permease subunit [Candidatus Bipolaricaulis sp.]HRU22119.1 ABC transporter permease subunit [Candidatus Bipolaricaulis sp.]
MLSSPSLRCSGSSSPSLWGGAVLTETVFSWPGVASYLMTSITARDYPAIQGTVIFIAIFISVINLIIDVLYTVIDPRVRY